MRPHVCSDADMYDAVNPADDTNGYATRILAEGDSWFAMGNLAAANLLEQQDFDQSTIIVNCAYSGDTVRRMVTYMVNQRFYDALQYRDWSGVFLSGGGNDLIDAINGADGTQRILKAAANPLSMIADDWIDSTDLQALVDYVRLNLAHMISWRSGINAQIPVLLNTYDYAMPRPEGLLVAGPWLQPRLKQLNAPPGVWGPVARRLIRALADAIGQLHDPAGGVYVVRTPGTLTPAGVDTKGVSGDWANEIHPTKGGYTKLCAVWKEARQAWGLGF